MTVINAKLIEKSSGRTFFGGIMYNRQDAFYRKAKLEGYKSRAAYKLIELNKKYEIYRNGQYILRQLAVL